jgi:putative membrane protein
MLITAAAATALAGAAMLASHPTPASAADARTLSALAALDDPTIVAIFDAANTWDMETGALGEQKGTTKEIRDFAKQLVNDHRMVRQQGRDLAKKLKVTPTPPKDFAMAKDHDAAMKKLRAAKGKDFDRAFLENEVAYHKAVIDAVNQQLMPAIQNQELKDLVTKIAPAFQAHMVRAQTLLDQMKK